MSNDFLQEPSFVEIERQAFQSIQRIFPCEKEFVDHIPLDTIWTHFHEQLNPQKHPFLIRVAGQSGSGKSSQIVPALEYALAKTNYFKINVGLFAQFHPHYTKWQKTCPGELREKTNGFALRALVLFYKQCLLNNINVILDMTLLEPEIDLYLMTLAKKMNYKIQTHILCIPLKISNLFIRRRQLETGRQVRLTSSQYFFNALPRCLKVLTNAHLFTPKDVLVLWSHSLSRPIRITHLNNPAVLRLLGQYRQSPFKIKDPTALLKAKKVWMKQLVEVLHV